LDTGAIISSTKIDVLRTKTPETGRTELWSRLLACNLIRLKILQSCAMSGRDPRSLSFTTTLQLLVSNWLSCAVIGLSSEMATLGITVSSSQRMSHGDGRGEPRVTKRRPKVLALMQKPRQQLRRELKATA